MLWHALMLLFVTHSNILIINTQRQNVVKLNFQPELFKFHIAVLDRSQLEIFNLIQVLKV